VPADALRYRLDSFVSADKIDRLANEFDVSSIVIEHQIKNHRLAWIDEDVVGLASSDA
jgi:hypothetical protein